MNTTSGGSLFLEVLKDEGVTHLFGNPGTTELPIMHALAEHPDLTYVLGLQESIVLAMADGFSRASGRLSSCNVHVAPGLGNAMGSLFNAAWSHSPVIVSAGQQEQGHGLTEPLLYGPLVPMASPVAKWAFEVTRTEDIPRVVRRAAKVAMTPPCGPVFLSLPGDVLNNQLGMETGTSTRVDTRVRPSDAALEALARRLLAAERPLLVCGQELADADALAAAARLAELIGAGAFQQTVPTGAHYHSEHRTYLGGLTRIQSQVREALSGFDLLVALGADVLRMSVYSEVEAMPDGLPVVHVSQHDWDMAKNGPAEMAVRAHLGETLEALVPVVERLRSAERAESAERRLAELAPRNWTTRRAALQREVLERPVGSPLHPDQVMLAVVESLADDAIVVDEGLTTSRNLPALYPYRERHDFYGLDSGGIGFAIAGSIGIQLAHPERPVTAVIGDGSAMYSIQALWTAAHMKLPMTYVIANNSSYRILKERLLAFHDNDQFTGMDMRDPPISFSGLAESFGMRSVRVEHGGELRDALAAAHAGPGPCLVEVMVEDGFAG